jgi:hypothetical protein
MKLKMPDILDIREGWYETGRGKAPVLGGGRPQAAGGSFRPHGRKKAKPIKKLGLQKRPQHNYLNMDLEESQ